MGAKNIFRVAGDDELGVRMADWHGGMGDPVYAVASSFVGGHTVSSEIVDAALVNLRSNKRLSLSNADQKHLNEVIRDLEQARASSASGQSRSDTEFPSVSLDGNMSDETVKRLKKLLEERLPDRYPMEFPPGSADDKVASSAKLNAVTGQYGKNRYVVSKDKLNPLLVRWLLGRSDAARDLATGILGTVQIEVV